VLGRPKRGRSDAELLDAVPAAAVATAWRDVGTREPFERSLRQRVGKSPEVSDPTTKDPAPN